MAAGSRKTQSRSPSDKCHNTRAFFFVTGVFMSVPEILSRKQKYTSLVAPKGLFDRFKKILFKIRVKKVTLNQGQDYIVFLMTVTVQFQKYIQRLFNTYTIVIRRF